VEVDVKAGYVALALGLLPGCLALRGGAGISYGGEAGEPQGTYDAEAGLLFPLAGAGEGSGWIASPLAIVRGRRSDGGWALGGLELARRVGASAPHPGPDRCAGGDGWTGNQLGGRLEAGRDDVGRYLGGALVVRRVFPVGGAGPVLPSVSLVINAGAHSGPVHGSAFGLRLLVGLN
jgi:hypothetical protein